MNHKPMNHKSIDDCADTPSRPGCIDIGANLTNTRFCGDLPDVLRQSRAAGVTQIVLTGSSERTSLESAAMCDEHPGFLYSTAGIHPHDASQYDQVSTRKTPESLFEKPQVVAVGECGPDYYREFSPRDKQRACFQAHLEMARITGCQCFFTNATFVRRSIATNRSTCRTFFASSPNAEARILQT